MLPDPLADLNLISAIALCLLIASPIPLVAGFFINRAARSKTAPDPDLEAEVATPSWLTRNWGWLTSLIMVSIAALAFVTPQVIDERIIPNAGDAAVSVDALESPAPPSNFNYQHPQGAQTAAMPQSRPASQPAPATNRNGRPVQHFRHYGTNPFYDTDEDNLSSFALDGDTASYEITLRNIRENIPITPEVVRVEDFLNALPQGYERPQEGMAVRLDGAPSAYGPADYHLVRVGVTPAGDAGRRNPVSVIMAIDVSGSMEGQPIVLAAQIAQSIISAMNSNDRIAAITYGGDVAILHKPSSVADANTLSADIRRLAARGHTPLDEAVTAAYQLAGQELSHDPNRNVRVIFISDGYGNAGDFRPEDVLARVEKATHKNTATIAIGVGGANYDDVMMEALANRGNGTYHYVADEAALERFQQTGPHLVLQPSPRDARIQVAFNPDAVRKYRLIGYENRKIADHDFRDDSLDFGEPGFGRNVTALYEIRLLDDVNPQATLMIATVRWRNPDETQHRETQASITIAELAPSRDEADPHLRRAADVAEFAEILRGSTWTNCHTVEDALANLAESAPIDSAGRNLA